MPKIGQRNQTKMRTDRQHLVWERDETHMFCDLNGDTTLSVHKRLDRGMVKWEWTIMDEIYDSYSPEFYETEDEAMMALLFEVGHCTLCECGFSLDEVIHLNVGPEGMVKLVHLCGGCVDVVIGLVQEARKEPVLV